MNAGCRLFTIAAVALSSAFALTAQGKIAWESDLPSALAAAKESQRPIVACFSMEGERVCDVIVAEHYSDPRLVELSKRTVNLFCSPHGTPAQIEMEKRVRIDLLKKDETTWMVAPQHVMFTPEGELIWAVPYYISAGELEWMWVEAIRKVDPDFAWEPGDRYRAPAKLAAKLTAAKEKQAPPPTRAEIKAILKEIKRGWGGYSGARTKLPLIVRNEGSQAKKYVERLLGALDTGTSGRVDILRVIARNAPRSWWSVAKSMLGHENESVRHAAVSTLGALADKRATKSLLGRWRKEKSEHVRGAILRAVVACGPTDSKVIKLLPFVIKDYKEENLRVQAAIAIASLDSTKAVHAGLCSAIADGSPRVRATAAWAAASRRDDGLAAALEAAMKKEQDAETKQWFAEALAVLEGGTMEAFAEFPELGK